MKTFAQFMEQVEVVDQTKLAVAKVRGAAAAERLRKRRQYQQVLHTTMHLNQTAEKEDREKDAAYNT